MFFRFQPRSVFYTSHRSGMIIPMRIGRICHLSSGQKRPEKSIMPQMKALNNKVNKKGILRPLSPRFRQFLYSFLIVFTFLIFSYFLCLHLEKVECFQSLLVKLGLSLGGRALTYLLLKIGCSCGLTFAFVRAVRALFSSESAPFLGNWMDSSGAGPSHGPETSTARDPEKREAAFSPESSIQIPSSSDWAALLQFFAEEAPNEGDHEATSQATGVMEQTGPSQATPAAMGPEDPPISFLKKEIVRVLRSCQHRRPRADVLEKVFEDLHLETASPQKQKEIANVLNDIYQLRDAFLNDQNLKAKDALTVAVHDWERAQGHGPT